MVYGISSNGKISKIFINQNNSSSVSSSDYEQMFNYDVSSKDKGLVVEKKITSKVDPKLVKLLGQIRYNNNEFEIDGNIGDFNQGKIGDCYFLAGLYSVANTENGKNIIKNNIKKDANDTYNVTLPGAVMAAKDQKRDGLKTFITGKYKITNAELSAAKASGKYSKGDDSVLLMELAFEKYREEVIATNQANKGKTDPTGRTGLYAGEYIGGGTTNDPLSGGRGMDAMFILTGQKSELYVKPKDSTQNEKRINERKNSISPKHLDSKLDEIQNNPNRYAVTAGFLLKNKEGKIIGGHAFSIKAVDANYVYLVNPWDSSKTVRMTREQFKEKARTMEMADMAPKQNGHVRIGTININSNALNNPQKHNNKLDGILNSLKK